MKILINKCHGVFEFSPLFIKKYENIHNESIPHNIREERTDSRVIALFEQLGSEQSSGEFSRLQIVEIPDDIDWEINEYDGHEKVVEKHRSWS